MERRGGGGMVAISRVSTHSHKPISLERVHLLIANLHYKSTSPPHCCSAAFDCSLGKKREKEREHLDGVVEASPVNVAPISARLQSARRSCRWPTGSPPPYTNGSQENPTRGVISAHCRFCQTGHRGSSSRRQLIRATAEPITGHQIQAFPPSLRHAQPKTHPPASRAAGTSRRESRPKAPRASPLTAGTIADHCSKLPFSNFSHAKTSPATPLFPLFFSSTLSFF
ncbi:hypothetical protein VIGAN_02129400 [Vigna angularis var. angularis]|uniref:Uncharacterized protein n=1 Tax=Vigna angularis var. angularis TaxID=157739 RepID=A0A0S3RD25_PHAAN|nr:hypothetical protein VIGAN_02129400 [Vigna angularis var. angularis]